MSDFIYHEPIARSIKNMHTSKVVSETGFISLMCPECFHIENTRISSSIIIQNNSINKNFRKLQVE